MTMAAALVASEEQTKPLEEARRVQEDSNEAVEPMKKWRRGFKLRLSSQDYVCSWN